MSLVQVTRDLTISTAAIASMTRDTRHYMNGAGPTVLIIRMADGAEHRVEHTPHHLGGNDVYAIERRLTEAASDETDVRTRVARFRADTADEDGCWRTCSGCHESEDGYDVGHYPHSQAFGCKLGGGCGECGGVGATWDTTDWDAAADHMIAADRRLHESVLIWSGEHHAYWRPNSAGYTTDGLGAGIYDRQEAESIVAGVGREKKLEIKLLDPLWPLLAAARERLLLGDGV